MGMNEKVDLLKKYCNQIATSWGFYIKNDIPVKKINNAMEAYAPTADKDMIIGLYDTTISRGAQSNYFLINIASDPFNTKNVFNESSGYLFTDTMVYWKGILESPMKLWYGDIERVELFNTDNPKDCDRGLRLHIYGGETLEWTDPFLNKTPLYFFFKELIEMPDIRKPSNDTTNIERPLRFIEMCLTDLVKEGKKRGYNRAAREYTFSYEQIKAEYENAKKKLNSDESYWKVYLETLLRKLETLEEQADVIRQKINEKTKRMAKKHKLPLPSIQSCSASYFARPLGNHSEADILFPLNILYDYKKKQIYQAELEGYLEAKKIHEDKIRILKKDFNDYILKINSEKKDLLDLSEEILGEIDNQQKEVVFLKFLLESDSSLLFDEEDKKKSKSLREKKNKLFEELKDLSNSLQEGYAEANRVQNVVNNTYTILENLDEEFRRKTGLTKMDVVFLFVAVGLQIARQYLLSNEKFRLSAAQADKLMEDALSLAPPKWNEVFLQSVPYDAIRTGAHVSDTGLAGTTHRYRTLGHDPIFGWIFGTANIMTNSLTKTNFETYQVKNMCMVRHYPLGVAGMLKKAIEYSVDDPKLLAVSLARQAIHFGSDYFTKQGLPVPGVSMMNDDLIMKMTSKWNIDTFSITRGATVSTFINQLIAMTHRLFFDGNTEMDEKLYEVRTRKILSYSNLIATSSNIAVVAVTKDMTKLDAGGMAVTIYRLITDAKFIRQVKEEFIFGSYKDMIMGDCLR